MKDVSRKKVRIGHHLSEPHHELCRKALVSLDIGSFFCFVLFFLDIGS